MKKTLFLLVLILTMAGCSGKMPSCDGKEEQKLVFQSITEMVQDTLVLVAMQDLRIGDLPLVKYKNLKEMSSTNEDAAKLVDYINNWITNAGLTIETIRIDSINKEIKKVSCKADLKFKASGKSIPIFYTAQIAADGLIVVEVAKLKFY